MKKLNLQCRAAGEEPDYNDVEMDARADGEKPDQHNDEEMDAVL
jgi:hypothetical protein